MNGKTVTMVANHISSVLKQALTTFSNKREMFYQNLEILTALLEKTTAEDINLDPQFATEAVWKHPNKAPVTYIHIYEDSNVTMGIFVLKPGMTLPLHNHPNMYGLIKVVSGKVNITSYSLNTEKTRQIDSKTPGLTQFLTAEKFAENSVDTNSGCCLLEPDKKNLHEIRSVGGPAAFIDILAPPYDEGSVRKCSYFRILREVSPGVYRMVEVNSPSWYWTDSYPYTGPELT